MGKDRTPRRAAGRRGVDRAAIVVGGLRALSGVSFIVAPETANRLWGDDSESTATSSLLLRSMGYRDALVGTMLASSGLRGGEHTAGWFLASAGADASDLLGGVANHHRMSEQAARRGLGGAVVGIAVGVLGAAAASAGRRRSA